MVSGGYKNEDDHMKYVTPNILICALTLMAYSMGGIVDRAAAHEAHEGTKTYSKMNWAEKKIALLEAQDARNWVLLGIHGEFFAPVLDSWPSVGDLIIVSEENEKSIVAYYDGRLVARVEKDGVIKRRGKNCSTVCRIFQRCGLLIKKECHWTSFRREQYSNLAV